MTDTLLTPKNVSTQLSLSLPTVYRLIDSGRLPVVKLNRALRVRERDLQKMIDGSIERRGCLRQNWGA